MPYYVKVTPEVKKQILPEYVVKPKAADGNYLLFQSDLIGVEGNTLKDRADRVGGALLTPDERKAEGNGTADPPAKCYTPEEYGGTVSTKAAAYNSANDVPSQGSDMSNVTADVVIPSVIEEGADEDKAETKEESEVDHE